MVQSAILTLSAWDLDFIDSEVEAQMEEEEEETMIRGARGGGRQQFDFIISIHPKTYLTLIAPILLSCKNTFSFLRFLYLFVLFCYQSYFDLNQHHLKDPWLEKKHECANRKLVQIIQEAFD